MKEVLLKTVAIIAVITTIVTVMLWYLPFFKGTMGHFSPAVIFCNFWSFIYMIVGVTIAIIKLIMWKK